MAFSRDYATLKESFKAAYIQVKCEELAEKGNFVSALKELADFKRARQPRYDEIWGQSTFGSSCTFDDFETKGFGPSKKEAKRNAAKEMWMKLNGKETELQDVGDQKDSGAPQSTNFLKSSVSSQSKNCQPILEEVIGVKSQNPVNDSKLNSEQLLPSENYSLSDKFSDELESSDDERENLIEANEMNYVGILQEFCQKNSLGSPKYDYSFVKGYSSLFEMSCLIKDKKVQVLNRNLKKSKKVAAFEMLIKLGQISPQEKQDVIKANRPKKFDPFIELHTLCMKHYDQVPEYEDRLLDGCKKPMVEVICLFKGIKIVVRRRSLIKGLRAAADEMSEKLGFSPKGFENTSKITGFSSSVDQTIQVQTKKTESQPLMKSLPHNSRPNDSKASIEKNEQSCLNERFKGIGFESLCSVKGNEEISTENLLLQIYTQNEICCHQLSQKIDLDLWKTTNKLQDGTDMIFKADGFGDTFEASIEDANKTTLDAFLKRG